MTKGKISVCIRLIFLNCYWKQAKRPMLEPLIVEMVFTREQRLCHLSRDL